MLSRHSACALLLLVAATPRPALSASSSGPAADSDHDGLSDLFEQALLNKFAPAFHIESTDCALRPARFIPGDLAPTVAATDGTIYGQAFPHASAPAGAIELHFYHLWSTDCGPHGHALDTEHVAALLLPTPGLPRDDVATWHAAFWYAAAHENTVCDVSQITRASTLDATDHGAAVWISPGKHASFLALALCRGGCGGDRCLQSVALHPPAIINLGEAGAPAGGIAWLGASQWPLSAKMTRSDFPPAALARLDQLPATDIAWVRAGKHPAQQTIAISGATADALAHSAGNTGDALDRSGQNTDVALTLAQHRTGSALAKSYRNTRDALAHSARNVGRALKHDPPDHPDKPEQ